MEILTNEKLVGAKTAPTAISRTFIRVLWETRFLSKDSPLPTQYQMENHQILGSGVETGI